MDPIVVLTHAHLDHMGRRRPSAPGHGDSFDGARLRDIASAHLARTGSIKAP